MCSSHQQWRHPGGKLRELGPKSLTDTELLAILISSGIKGKPAQKTAEEILANFGSVKGMANQPLHKFLEIKGLGNVQIIRIAAAFDIARGIGRKEFDHFFAVTFRRPKKQQEIEKFGVNVRVKGKRLERILKVLEIIPKGEPLIGAYLTENFGVSSRIIERDLSLLKNREICVD